MWGDQADLGMVGSVGPKHREKPTMSTWLYQCDQSSWSPNEYRQDIWEGAQQRWPVGRKTPNDAEPQPGDVMAIFYAKSGGIDPGFYGWAVILRWDQEKKDVIFRPAAPGDHLKMNPWWNDQASQLANKREELREELGLAIPSELLLSRSAWLLASARGGRAGAR